MIPTMAEIRMVYSDIAKLNRASGKVQEVTDHLRATFLPPSTATNVSSVLYSLCHD